MADDLSWYEMLNADEPNAKAMAAAYAQALRKKRDLGTLGMLTGDRVLSGVGRSLAGDANQGEQQLQEAAGTRLRNAFATKQAAAQAAQQQAEMARQAKQDALHASQAAETARHNRATESLGSMGGAFGPGGGAGSPLNPEAIDQLAEMWHRTGTLPNFGMGKAGALIKSAVISRAAELHPGANLAENKATYGADSASVKKLQTQADNIEAFETTGKKNIENLLVTAGKIVNTGSPIVNKPARWIASNVFGDPDMSSFEAARQTAAVEAAKILGGALGPLSDSARHEAERMMDPDATPEQLAAAAKTLITDFGNRKSANQGQLGEIRARLGGKPPEPPATDHVAPPPATVDRDALRKKYGL